MKVLVTGCAGFIGSNLTDKLLSDGYEVIGIDCFTDYYPKRIKESNLSNAIHSKNFKLIQKDILDMHAFPEIDIVFHLAAQAGVRASWGEDFKIYSRNNIDATQALLEFYKDTNIKKFIYSSSSSVYGDAALPMKEESLLKPVSPYGVTKLAGENLCYLYYKNYGIPTVSLRYFTVYGPRQRPDMAISKFIKAIYMGEEVKVYGDGNQMRDFTYVDDAVNANILASESHIEGGVFNIGGGCKISINELINKLLIILESNVGVRYIEKQKGDVKHTLADMSKAKGELKWEPKIDIDKGLLNYIEWLKNTI